MYSHIIGVNDELWDIVEDDVGFTVDSEGMLVRRRVSLRLRGRST